MDQIVTHRWCLDDYRSAVEGVRGLLVRHFSKRNANSTIQIYSGRDNIEERYFAGSYTTTLSMANCFGEWVEGEPVLAVTFKRDIVLQISRSPYEGARLLTDTETSYVGNPCLSSLKKYSYPFGSYSVEEMFKRVVGSVEKIWMEAHHKSHRLLSKRFDRILNLMRIVHPEHFIKTFNIDPSSEIAQNIWRDHASYMLCPDIGHILEVHGDTLKPLRPELRQKKIPRRK